MISFLNKGSGIVEPFKKLDYIRNTSSSNKIDTQIYASNTLEFEIKYRQTTTENANTNTGAVILGGRNSVTSMGLAAFIRHSGYNTVKCTSIVDNSIHDFWLPTKEGTTDPDLTGTETFTDKPVIYKLKDGVTSITDGVTTLSTPVTGVGTFKSSYPLWLFGINSAGNLNDYCRADLYYCKLWQDGKLVRDFIPVIDNLDRVCLWDKVTQAFFYEANNNNFVAGYKDN